MVTTGCHGLPRSVGGRWGPTSVDAWSHASQKAPRAPTATVPGLADRVFPTRKGT